MKRDSIGPGSRLSALLVTLLLVAGAFFTPGGLRAQVDPSGFVCFPTCSPTDGRFLTVPGLGQQTLASQQVMISFNSAPQSPNITIGFFDGDSSGVTWDLPTTSPLIYELYPDPTGDQSGVNDFAPVVTWFGVDMADNAWSDMPAVIHPASAQACPTCPFRYVLVISNVNNSAVGLSSFKVRTDGTLGLRPQAFGFMNPRTSLNDRNVIYPNGTAQPSTYDGTWTFGFSVPAGTNRLTIWDGDLDWGSFDCSTRDTDDLDSPPSPIHPFLVTPAMLLERESAFYSTGQHLCPTAIGGRSSGNPSDDNGLTGTFRRLPLTGLGPNLYYRVRLPNATEYVNLEPSGDREWETFVLDADPTTVFDPTQMDLKVPVLPGGTYEVFVEGTDSGNLNFFYFDYKVLGLPPNGPPAPEDAFYRIERYVWYDTNSDGIKDVTESGIPGVVVQRTDATTGTVQFATTDATGAFAFRVAAGTYSLTVLPSNFNTGQPLNSLRFTGGNGYGATGEFVGNLVLGANNPYERRDFGYVRNTPPTTGIDFGACACASVTGTTIDVLDNDSDADGHTLTVTGITQPVFGTATLNADFTVTYVPTAGGYTGTDSFTYTVSDGKGGTATGTVTIDVTNNPPVLLNDSAVANSGSPVTVSVLLNDSDPDGGTVTVASASNGANGTTVVNGDGTITYTPNPGFSGIDTFSYTASDTCGEASAIVTIVVNTPPTPQPDAGACLCTGATTLNVLANDTDADGDNLTVTGVTQPAHGVATLINADGTVSYAPTGGYTGNDSFTYTVSDGRGGSAIGVVTITNNNATPILVNDAATTAAVTPVTVNVLANDSDPDGQALTVRSATQGTNGTTVVNPNGTITYTPNTGFSGTDTFSYTVFDGCAEVTATVIITVTPPPPVCDATGFTTYTPGGWGAKPSGNNPGMLLSNNFSRVYPGGSVSIGSGSNVLTFTSAKAIENFLPLGGNPGVLSGSATNPTTSVGGPFIGHLLSLQLAADFSRAGALKVGLGNMAMLSGPLAGQTVTQILALANGVAGGTVALPAGVSLTSLQDTLVAIIMNYHEGTVNGGLLGCGGGTPPPPPPPPPPVDPPPTTPCSFRTQTQGGWGSTPSGNNPGAFLEANFDAAFSTGVTIGSGSRTLRFTSAAAVRGFLPQGGKAGALTGSALNPTSSSAGVFGGQVLALTVSVGMSNAGKSTVGLANLRLASGPLAGKTVAEVLAMANTALGGGTVPGVSINTLNSVVDAINNNFVDGTKNAGYLVTTCPIQ